MGTMDTPNKRRKCTLRRRRSRRGYSEEEFLDANDESDDVDENTGIDFELLGGHLGNLNIGGGNN